MGEKSALAGRRTIRLSLAVLAVAAAVSLHFVIRLKPASAGAFAFLAIWLTAPHAAMAGLLLAMRRRGKAVLPWCVVSIVVAVGGLYVLLDVIYLHPDAQGAIGVVLTPILQGIAFFVAAPLAWWADKRSGERQE